MVDKSPQRQPAGTPTGGQFARSTQGRSEISLAEGQALQPTGAFDDGLDGPPLPPEEDILSASGDQLWDYVRHEDPIVRRTAVGNPNLSPEQIAELFDPERQPETVRMAVVRLPYGSVAERAVRSDPSPIVRWLAAAGYQSAHPGEDLAADDPEVTRLRAVLADQIPPASQP